MNFKIVNKKKFIRSIIVLFIIIIGISFAVSNKSLSHAESKYKTIYVADGDTLWSIAKQEKEINNYYENKDVRDIVNNIKAVNKLSNSDLSTNQKLIVPNI